MGQASSEKVMRILLATFKVQGNCFLLEHSEQQAEALRPRGQRAMAATSGIGKQKMLLFSQGILMRVGGQLWLQVLD